MKAKLSDIVGGATVISGWGQFTVSPRFGFTLARVSKVIEPIIVACEAERLKLLNAYGKPPEGGKGNYGFESQCKFVEFSNALAELLRTETELAGISPIPIKELEDEIGKSPGFSPTLAELISLSWLFDDEVKV